MQEDYARKHRYSGKEGKLGTIELADPKIPHKIKWTPS